MSTKIARRPPHTVLALAIAALLTLDIPLAHAQSESAALPKPEKWGYAAITKVPEKARARRNPLENDHDAVAAGGKLFEQHCAECHGMKAEGSKRAPSLLREEVQQATPGALFTVLTNGVVRHGMPDWSKLPEPQRWQIVTFLKSYGSASRPREPSGSE